MSFVSLPAPIRQPHAHLETVNEFYQEVDRLLDSPLEVPEAFRDDQTVDEGTKEHAAVFDKFQNFLALLEACYDKFLDQQYNLDYCITRLLESAFVKSHHDEVGACILDLLNRATTLPVLLVTYDLLLAWGQTEPLVYRTVHDGINGLAKDKITRLVHQIWAGHYAAVADARLGGGVASNVTKHWYARTNGRRESLAAHFDDFPHQSPLPPHLTLAGADTSGDSNLVEISDGHHPVHHHLVGQVGETSNAARTRIHQIRLRDKAIQILYEVCRVQRLDPSDMRAVDEKFVNHLFDLVEETRLHEDEAFNYLLIKLIVALNEQFMVNSIALKNVAGSMGGNIVLGILKSRLHVTKTFGENLIFMLNRASSSSAEDFCMQLLVLKLLYLLFTTKETAHYFYTNDLRVLVDVFIRELSDLPEESESLRHTYLRVLHPLLTHTQLCSWPYKRPQIRRLLKGMVQDSLYRGAVSPTTRRLVQRCLDAEWCIELDRLDPEYKAAVQRSNGRENSDGAAIALVQSIGQSEPAKLQYVGREVTPEGVQSRHVIVGNSGPSDGSSGVQKHLEEVANTVDTNITSSSAMTQDGSHTSGDSLRLPSTPIKHVPSSAPPPVLTTPPTLLNAPRFRNIVSARSAPSSPPPRLDNTVAQERAFVLPSDTGEEEAMAFAHAQTRRQSTLEPSWQSQIARESAELGSKGVDERAEGDEDEVGVPTILSASPVQSSGLLLPPPQRPIARRASHGELRTPSQSNGDFRPPIASTTSAVQSSSSSIRRPPPAPPALAATARKREGLPASSSELVYPSTLQFLSGAADEEEDAWDPPTVSAPPHASRISGTDGSRKLAPLHQARDRASAASADGAQRGKQVFVVPGRSSSHETPARQRRHDAYSSAAAHEHYGDDEDDYKDDGGELPVPLQQGGDRFIQPAFVEAGDGYLPSFTSPISSGRIHGGEDSQYAHGSGYGFGLPKEAEDASLAQQLSSNLTLPAKSEHGGAECPTEMRSSTPSAPVSGSRAKRRAPPAPPPIMATGSSSPALANIVVSPTSADSVPSGSDTGSYHWPSAEEVQGDTRPPQLDPQRQHRRFFTRSRVSSDVGHSSLAGLAPPSIVQGQEMGGRIGGGGGGGGEGEEEEEGDGVAMRSEGEDSSLHPPHHHHHSHHVRKYISKHLPRSRNFSAGADTERSPRQAPPNQEGTAGVAGGGAGAGAGAGGQRRRPPPPPVNRSTKTSAGTDTIAFRA